MERHFSQVTNISYYKYYIRTFDIHAVEAGTVMSMIKNINPRKTTGYDYIAGKRRFYLLCLNVIFMYILTLHCIFLVHIYSRILAFWPMLSVLRTTLSTFHLILSLILIDTMSNIYISYILIYRAIIRHIQINSICYMHLYKHKCPGCFLTLLNWVITVLNNGSYSVHILTII